MVFGGGFGFLDAEGVVLSFWLDRLPYFALDTGTPHPTEARIE
jgi:hypothetical protein